MLLYFALCVADVSVRERLPIQIESTRTARTLRSSFDKWNETMLGAGTCAGGMRTPNCERLGGVWDERNVGTHTTQRGQRRREERGGWGAVCASIEVSSMRANERRRERVEAETDVWRSVRRTGRVRLNRGSGSGRATQRVSTTRRRHKLVPLCHPTTEQRRTC